MRILLQRVKKASITIENRLLSEIDSGLLLLLGIEAEDGPEDIEWLAGKVVQMRLFNDEHGVMNKSLLETGGDIMLVSQFTLHANIKKGNRPSYIRAARPEVAIPLYEQMIRKLQDKLGKEIATGSFGADMQVALINDGPVTIWMDSKDRK
ncbi:D-aminoacyl-tRNA deacylase [Arachidicoccus terrestris]|uniref:D-aminoacyl-tRNA deacylase n=1 Tax=Arachidicoccus terrestris TaxID=2875539 RepID=UPI001CC63FBB|nr:D-aminoacyl-tRNA deacylase [Arachidicoccus terrestris]UAY55622.1 D-tyrosyl-tRNA(Tyr) deacylase [Arachidicoccus terrestris]